MGLFKSKEGSFFDVIRCDEPEYLIWKWHPAGVASGEGKRENSIRWGRKVPLQYLCIANQMEPFRTILKALATHDLIH